MDQKKRPSGKRPKKRHFCGNQYTKGKTLSTGDVECKVISAYPELIVNTDPELADASFQSARVLSASQAARISASKKKIGMKSPRVISDATFDGNIIIDKSLLFSFLEKNLCCKSCHGDVKITDKRVIGLSTSVSITCDACKFQSSIRNSKLLGQKKNIPEINRRITYAMRCVGQGLEGIKTFCGVMDLYPPVSQNSYDKICKRINIASKTVANESMKKAAQEEVYANNSTDISVSGDGTWKTRGHSSQIGVCTVIGSDTGKVIDVKVLSTACKGCESWKAPRSGDAFKEWNAKHTAICTKNHTGSSGKMEADGMVQIFKRSISERGARYMIYIGDGDSKTFSSILESEPYGKDKVTKRECISHVQKRMGTRLRKLKKEYGSKKLSDKKSISGKGRLTDAVIDKLSSYYGNAIRQNSNSVQEMRNAVWAIYFHTRSTDKEPLHNFCPSGLSSWCKFQRAVADGSIDSFQHKNSLPPAIMDAIKPVFNSLSNPELLNRCLGAFTQNANESLNSVIWQLCPKTSGSGRTIAEIAVNEGVIVFNDGRIGRLSVMKELGLSISIYAIETHNQADSKRLSCAERRKNVNTIQKKRSKKRAKLCSDLLNSKLEGTMYEPGGF